MDLRYLSMSQLSEVTGVDRRTVKSRLANVEPHKTEGRAIIYDSHEALPIILGFQSESPKETDRQLKEEQLRYESARADKMRLEADQMAGDVVAIDDVTRMVSKEYTYVRATLYSIPSKLATTLAREEDVAVVQAKLHSAIDEALAHLQADTNKDYTQSSDEGEEKAEAD